MRFHNHSLWATAGHDLSGTPRFHIYRNLHLGTRGPAGSEYVVVDFAREDRNGNDYRANFDTQQTSSQAIKEVALHGDTALDTPAYRATFLPIDKNTTNEIKVDVLMEVR